MLTERYFIVTPGRSGSSLLAAILAASGANFGMPPVDSWDANSGAMEHPDFEAATTLLGKAQELSPAKPGDPFRQAYWSLYRHNAKRKLRRSLERATFVKSVDADLALQMAMGLGYAPRVIVSYRHPEPQIASQFVRTKYWTVDYLLARYERVMCNALGAARILGGCVVSFDELHDLKATAWARALASLTGLTLESLLQNRAELLRPAAKDGSARAPSPRAERLWLEAEDLRGQVLRPARPAARWTAPADVRRLA